MINGNIMEENSSSKTLKYTKDLSLLYVEDDLDLQKYTAELFNTIFADVTTANNGAEALKLYKEKTFDIVVSDIRMPVMDGLELIKKIKEIDSSQVVIVTSAYSDSESLVEFINLNINHFLIKPVTMNNLMNIIYEISKNIVNSKMVELYKADLESKNLDLKRKNEELESLVRILDSKILQISKNKNSAIRCIDFDNVSISNDDLDKLKEIEDDISTTSVLISLSKKVDATSIKILAKMFFEYSEIVSQYEEYKTLCSKIKLLAELFKNSSEDFIKHVEEISVLLESFIYVLRMWRKDLCNDENKKAFELHASMIKDIDTIVAILNNTKDDDE
jgi:YesN/AraC family two-component response regulator